MTHAQERPSLRAILIGGTSHAGKSTLAAALAAHLSWEHRSTDRLARHPGRPWSVNGRPVPSHVAEHYATLSPDELLADVLEHYRVNVMPQVQEILNTPAADASSCGLVLEGSALWPDYVANLLGDEVMAVWLVAPDKVIADRIRGNSRCADASATEQHLIQKFIDRTLLYNRQLITSLAQHGLTSLKAHAAPKPTDHIAYILNRLHCK